MALLLWEVVARVGLVPATEVPPATTVLRELVRQLTQPAFWDAIAATLAQWAIGMGLTTAIAVPIGLLMGSLEPVWRAFRPTVEFLRPVPGMALVPLAILLWGLRPTSVVFLIVFGSVWSLIVTTMYGARNVDEGARDTARSFRLTRIERTLWVVLPSALPYVATGLRVASATALIIAVGAELVIGVNGIGYDIARAQTAGAVAPMYALILTSGLIGVAIHLAFSRLERRFLRWHQSQRREVTP
ncbi:ABC transporter permease [Dactylosporangium sucinum]|uniref:ABC transporter permease n=1 Tax=Dactylosporangium sucinum TaxID=1424081 RepID=UPI00167D9D0B|nr:ABC transporter permease [Dactylosporangium sucinum]